MQQVEVKMMSQEDMIRNFQHQFLPFSLQKDADSKDFHSNTSFQKWCEIIRANRLIDYFEDFD